jgi:glucose dehydrogenase
VGGSPVYIIAGLAFVVVVVVTVDWWCSTRPMGSHLARFILALFPFRSLHLYL